MIDLSKDAHDGWSSIFGGWMIAWMIASFARAMLSVGNIWRARCVESMGRSLGANVVMHLCSVTVCFVRANMQSGVVGFSTGGEAGSWSRWGEEKKGLIWYCFVIINYYLYMRMRMPQSSDLFLQFCKDKNMSQPIDLPCDRASTSHEEGKTNKMVRTNS